MPAHLVVSEWFRVVGSGSNEPLSLFVGSDGLLSIASDEGDVATLMSDWSVELKAPDVAALAALLKIDLDFVASTKS